jgi:hypothetical protein
MSAFDKLVSRDLAALAAESRRRVPTVDEMLRIAVPRSGPRARDGEMMIARLASVFAQRVACGIAGAVALVSALVLMVGLSGPEGEVTDGRFWLGGWSDLMHRDALSFAVWLSVALLVSYVAAGAIARWWISRQMTEAAGAVAVEGGDVDEDRAARAAVECGRQLVGETSGWSIALWAAGITSLVAVIGVVTFVLGLQRWDTAWDDWVDARLLLSARRRDLVLVIVGAILAGVAIRRACLQPERVRGVRSIDPTRGDPPAKPSPPPAISRRSIDPRLVMGLGAVLGIATLVVFVARQVGPFRWLRELAISSSALGSGLTASGAVAVLLIVVGSALWQRGRERRALALTDGDAVPSRGREMATLAAVFEARGARIVGGAVAVLCAGAFLALLYGPGGVKQIIRIIDGVDQGMSHGIGGAFRRLVDHLPVPAFLAAVALIAYVVGGRLAAWWFERQLAISRHDDARDAARALVRRLDGASVAFAIAGVASLAAVLGAVVMTVGDHVKSFFVSHGPRVAHVIRHTLGDATLGFVLSLAVAVVVARACVRTSARGRCWLAALERRDSLIASVVMIVAIKAASLQLDFGVFDISGSSGSTRMGAHLAMSLLWTLAVLWAMTSYLLRRRRRELAAIDATH